MPAKHNVSAGATRRPAGIRTQIELYTVIRRFANTCEGRRESLPRIIADAKMVELFGLGWPVATRYQLRADRFRVLVVIALVDAG